MPIFDPKSLGFNQLNTGINVSHSAFIATGVVFIKLLTLEHILVQLLRNEIKYNKTVQ